MSPREQGQAQGNGALEMLRGPAEDGEPECAGVTPSLLDHSLSSRARVQQKTLTPPVSAKSSGWEGTVILCQYYARKSRL